MQSVTLRASLLLPFVSSLMMACDASVESTNAISTPSFTARVGELVPDARLHMESAAVANNERLFAGDLAGVIEQMPLDLFPGGMQNKMQAMKNAGATASMIELASNMVWLPSGPIHKVADRYVSVLHYESQVQGKRMSACQIGVSSDAGRTWGFLSGSVGAVQGLRELAPEIVDAIEAELAPVAVGGRSLVVAEDKDQLDADWQLNFGAPELASGEGVAAFAFNWPSRIHFQVRRNLTRYKLRSNVIDRFGSVLEYRMIGEQTADGYRISFEGITEMDSGNFKSSECIVQLDDLAQRLADWPVDFLVKDPAESPTTINLATVQSELRRRYGEIDGLDSDAEARQMLEVITSDAFLATRALEGWNQMVQIWHGNEIEFASPVAFAIDSGLGAQSIESTLTYSIHPSPRTSPDSYDRSLLRLHSLLVPVRLNNGLKLMEKRTWVDASQDLIPKHYVSVTTFKQELQGVEMQVGSRWEYEFTREAN